MKIIETPIFVEEIPEKGSAKAHVQFNILSQSPEDIALVGFCAHIASSVLFERLHAGGTNMVLQLGKQSRLDVLARMQDDGLKLQWVPKQVEPVVLDEIRERIWNKTFYLQNPPKETIVVTPVPQTPSEAPELSEEEEDYQVKQLLRVP